MPFLDWLGLGGIEPVVAETPEEYVNTMRDQMSAAQSVAALSLSQASAAQNDYYQQLANQHREYFSRSTFVVPTSGVYNTNVAGQAITSSPGIIHYSGERPEFQSISGPGEFRQPDTYHSEVDPSDEEIIEMYHQFRKLYLEMLLVKPWEMV